MREHGGAAIPQGGGHAPLSPTSNGHPPSCSNFLILYTALHDMGIYCIGLITFRLYEFRRANSSGRFTVGGGGIFSIQHENEHRLYLFIQDYPKLSTAQRSVGLQSTYIIGLHERWRSSLLLWSKRMFSVRLVLFYSLSLWQWSGGEVDVQRLLTPAGRRGGVILVNPGISGVFLKTGPDTPLGVASLNLNFELANLGRTIERFCLRHRLPQMGLLFFL